MTIEILLIIGVFTFFSLIMAVFMIAIGTGVKQ